MTNTNTASTGEYPCIALDPALPFFHPRERQTHKGSYGTLLLICGSYGMIGAAAMAAKAALRCGAGLVHLVVRQSCYPLLAPMLPEAVFTVLEDAELEAFPALCAAAPTDRTKAAGTPAANVSPSALPSDDCRNRSYTKFLQAIAKASVCVIGCGLGEDASFYLPVLFSTAACPVVADADALNFLARQPHLFDHATSPLFLTPHPAEMARLCGNDTTVGHIQANRIETAIAFAKQHHAYTILKGADTIVATPEGRASINPTGNAGMAKGGSGDVLAGMLGAFLAQKIAPDMAAEAAVYIHGAVGDACAEALSQTAMQPTDMIAALPEYFRQLMR